MSKSKSSLKKTKRKLKGKVNDFSQSVGLSPVKMVGALLLLCGIGFIIYFVAFAPKTVDGNADTPSLKKLQAQELDLEQRLDALAGVKTPNDTHFMMIIDRMNDINSELDTIEYEKELTESQKIKVEQIRLRNKSLIVMTMMRNKIENETEKNDLIEYCLARIDSPDDILREGCHFWLCVIPTFDFSLAPSDESLQIFTEAIQKYPQGYRTTPSHATTIAGIVFKIREQGPAALEFQKKGLNFLATQFKASEVAEVQEVGKKLNVLELFGEFNIPTLAHRILWSDPSGKRDLDGALAVLTEHPDTEMTNWVKLIRAYECFLATDKIEEIGAAWQKMWSLMETVPDQKIKEALKVILERQKTRAMAIGTPFDVSGTLAPDGQPFVNDDGYTVVVFCDKSVNSQAALAKLGKGSREQQLKYRPIIALDGQLTERDVESLKFVPQEISFASDETAKKYFEAFPVDFFPYVMLVDRKGNIVAANLDVDQVPSRVAKLEANIRRANNNTLPISSEEETATNAP